METIENSEVDLMINEHQTNSDKKKAQIKEILDENVCWNLINKYFTNDQYALVKHHIDSYDDFF